MSGNYQQWKKLFLFCLGLAVSAAFCMKWMENSFWVKDEKFTIIGLELIYTKEKMISILSGIADHVKTILRFHLSFDFAFMAGVYPGITALCMMAREKIKPGLFKEILFVAGVFQLVAWGCDIAENSFLLSWIRQPVIEKGFTLYHGIVWTKWLLALAGLILSLPFVFRKKIVVNS
jgi:hypothetical protein